MTAIDDARVQLQGRPRTPERPWEFPSDRTDLLLYHRVLVFDGTLTNAGWAFMEARAAGIIILDKGTLRPQTELTGYAGTWEKAVHLDSMLTAAYFGSYATGADSIVVEAPAVKGNRTESSLIAGLIIMLRFRGIHDLQPVSATHVSAVLLGASRIRSAERKKQIREAVIRLCPPAAGRGWNEHERDAVATGITHLWDLKRKTLDAA